MKNIRWTKINKTLAVFLLILLMCQACLLAACGKDGSKVDIDEQWGETQSLSVATDWAGIDFVSPPETFVTDDGKSIELTTYRYRTDVVEALYRGDDHELVFRRSDTLQGRELAEDDRSYSKEWDAETGGLGIHCFGDGSGINLAFFDMDNDHYSVTCHIGSEDAGLLEEDLAVFLEPVMQY